MASRRRDLRLAWLVGLWCVSTGVVLLVAYGLRALLGL
ncbi:MAG TPA: DUF2474 domain-containing protein [Alphaproteobacteria bacterium]|nr:DUF2474 domain-containing protein [Alphaproteobacteria bacterium]